MAGSTPIYGIPYPQASDLVAAYPALGEDLAETLDEKLPSYQATAPATPSVGQIWIDSDDDIGRVWDGAAWIPFSGAGTLTAGDVSGTTGSPTITTSGIYTIYQFTGSGSITTTKSGLCDLLVIGAGGSTANRAGSEGSGGGGAGGYLDVSGAYLPSGAQTVTVGAGGADGLNGNASRVGGIYYGIGGGAGGNYSDPFSANNGGSGGGCGGSPRVAGTGTPGQGNAGGLGNGTFTGGFGGGGGASAVGVAAASTSAGGAGGAGSASSITGSSVTYAGGGGGFGSPTNGAGGVGGGGAGASTTGAGTNGTVNTGGGAGGGFNTNTRASGGSGIVIVRVLT